METKLSAEEAKDLEEQVSVPYRVEDVTVLSPGEWNGLDWTASELRQAVERTDFSLSRERGDERPPNSSIYFNHEDRSADQWIGNVENVRVEGSGDVKTDLVITDKQLAMNLEYGAPFGVSPKADGFIDEQKKMQDFSFENFSMVVNPAVKTTWLNEDIEEVLQDMEIHRPKYQSTTKSDWNSPNLEDFTDKSWSDMSRSEKQAVGRHFLVSKTGFPADTYTSLALPIVEPDGALNLNALQNAKSRVSQVSGIDEDGIARVSRMVNNLANGNFEDADFSDVEMKKNGYNKDEKDMSKHKDEMDDGDGSEEAEGIDDCEDDITVKTNMANEETEQEPEAEESVQEESVENSEDFVTADQLDEFKSNLMDELKQELADGDDDEAVEEAEDDGDDVEEVEEEASDKELSQFEQFRQENPDMTLSEAAKEFEEANRDVEDKIEEMSQTFEEKIDELESKLESKEEEVEELSEKVENPQRATQAADDGDGEDIQEKVSNLSDDELHAQIFQQLDSKGGVSATKEMMHNG